MFSKNIDRQGQVIRGILATLLILMAWIYASWILLLVALFVYFEVYMSWCALYQLFGINQCPVSEKKEREKNPQDRDN